MRRRPFGDFAPGFVGFTDDVPFDRVWTRPELSPKERSLITVAARTVGEHRATRVPPRPGPGRAFDLALPLDQADEGYRAMDERRAIKALLRP